MKYTYANCTSADVSDHVHKKGKDSLEGSLDRVLFAAELVFLKILVPRIPQHTSNADIESTRKLNVCVLYM